MLAQNKFYYNIIIVLHLIIFAFALIKGFLQNCRNMVAKSGEMLYITHVGHFPDVIRLERYRRGHNEPHSKCGRQETGARVRIPFSPPQGVAFEHAALLLLLKRRCRYRFSNKTISNKAFRPLSHAETRCSRQLCKITH